MRNLPFASPFFIFCTAFLLLIKLSVLPAQTGSPALRYFSPTEYKGFAQNWCITQDKRGVMYFGNGKGILEYNGKTWRRFPTAQHSTVLSLACDAAGKIYVGGEGEIGYLSADSLGESYFVSLNDKLSEAEKKFTYVWSTYATTDGVCFVTSEKIICWNGKSMRYFHPKETFFTSFCSGGTLYVMSNNEGLIRLKNGRTEVLENTLELDKAGVRAVMAHEGNNLLIVTRNSGCFIYDGKQLKKMACDAEGFFKEKSLYKGALLPDGNYALVTTGGGVLIMDKKGKTMEVINESKGLQGSSIYNVFVDRENEVWLAQESGITRLRYSLPLRFFDQRHGLQGIVRNLFRLGDHIYISTFQGLHQQNTDGTFSIYENVTGQVTAAVSFQEKSIIAASEKFGMVELYDGKKNYISGEPYLLSLVTDPGLPVVYAGALGKAHVFSKEKDEWKKIITIDSLDDEISSMALNRNTLWMSTSTYGLVYEVKFKDDTRTTYELQRYDSLNGLPGGIIEVSVFGGKLYASTSMGVYTLDAQAKKFVPDSSAWRSRQMDGEYDFLLSIDKDKNYWSLNKKGIGYFHQGNYFNTPFKCIGYTDYYALLHDKGNTTWIGGTGGAVLYTPNTFKKFDLPFQTLINKVVHEKDTIFKGNFLSADNSFTTSQPSAFRFNFPFKNNSISFEFTSAFFDNEDTKTYSYMLEGFDKEWSPWTSETKKEYTNLHEGDYVFKVHCRNVYYQEGEAAEFAFSILTPWYRSWWAYSLYSIISFAAVYTVIRVKTAQLKKENEKLERIVSERTAEVVRQKDEIEEKSKNILDSINYAQRIQSAIMPSKEDLETLLPESFILFRPKDIVSGDFYWISRQQDFIFVATADCTGHGVPGAFMSMLGSSLLNEVINEKHIYAPDIIMNTVRDKIILALKQKGVSGENKDGMDMVLYRLDKLKNELIYSAANNPLWLMRKGECLEFPADKQPVGISGTAIQPFTPRKIGLQKGDVIYTFTDGYADQFGGPKGKKFKYKQMLNLIVENSHLPLSQQAEILEQNFTEWKGTLEQIDDVLVIGIRI